MFNFPHKDFTTVGSWFYNKLRGPAQDFKRDVKTISRAYDTKFKQPARKEVSKYFVGKPFKPVDVGRGLIKDAPQVRRDVGTIGSWFLNKMRERIEDVATIGRALPQVKTPFGAIRKMTYEPEVSRIGQSFKGGVAGTMEGTGRGLEWLGFDKMKPFNDKVQEWKENLEVENQTFVEKLYSGIGSMSLFYAPGLGAATVAKTIATVSPKIAMLVGGGTMTAFEAMTEAGNTWQETKDMGLDEREADKKAEKVFWANAVLIGITNKLGFFGEHKKGLLKKLLMTSTMEGTQEFGQEVIQNVTMGRQWDLNAYEAGKIGFLIGGLFGFGDINPSNQKQVANKTQKILGLSETQSIKFIGMVQDFQEKATKYVKEIKPGLTIEDVSQSDKYLETMRRPQLDPLITEARKYKSAEEFVEAQPKVYHGTSEVIVGEFKFPLHLTSDKKYAEVYKSTSSSSINPYKKGGGEKVYDFIATAPKERILDVRNPKHLKMLDEYFASESISGAFYKTEKGLVDWTDGIGISEFVEKKKLPFDAVLLDEGSLPNFDGGMTDRGISYMALNKNAIKTKSQLTDIFNKAKTLPQAQIKPIAKSKAEEGVKLPVKKEAVKTLPKRITEKTVKEFVGKKPAPFKKKRETTLLKERIKNVARGYREGRTMTKDEITTAQTEIVDILDKSKLDRSDKAKFIRAIKNVQTTEQLKKALPEIQARIETLAEKADKRLIINEIQKEFKYTKPVKKGQKLVSKFDYQTGKLLENLRDLNKITQEKAEIELNNMPQEDLSEMDKIKIRLLSLKANGAKSSLVLHEQVLSDIRELKRIGMDAKNEADFLKKVEQQEKIEEVLSGIEKQKESGKIFKGLKTHYVSVVANLYSTINTIAGKGIADKYDYGMFQTNSRADFNSKSDKMANRVKEIYDIKKDSHLNKLFIDELNNQDFTIIDESGFKESISRFNLMNIYNGLKNDLVRERYYNAFGETQINSLLQNLTQEDIKLADELMQEVQEYKEILNQRSIEITGRDMGSIENYWPSVSEFQAEFFDDIKIQGETPSAMKKRSVSSKVIPKTANAWLIYQKHIAQAEHIKTVSRKYEELKRTFSDRQVEKTIKKKYGDEVYYTLQNHIDTFSLNKRTEAIDTFSGIYNTALNNWVKAKIVSPTVFARQLISSVYSVEEVGIKNFIKYNIARNPRKAFNFMWGKVPFVKNRFRRGHSEALQDVMSGANNLKLQTDGITRYTTLLVRGGDITGVIANGYPIIQTEMEKGKTLEEAVEKFQKFTEKTQQSPAPANLSQLQRQRNAFARTFLRFKNTLNQLLRLQVDANIQFVNGQITAKQLATKTALYSIYTPMMYVLIGYAIKNGIKALAGKYDDEEEKSLAGNILQNMIIQPFQAIPLLDAATEVAYSEIRKRTTGKTYYLGQGLFSYPLLDDIATAWSKLTKNEPSTSDFLRVFSLLQEPVTGLPTETLSRYYGYVIKEPKTELDKAIKEQTKERDAFTENAEKLFEEFNELPPKEANQRLRELSETDLRTAKKISDMIGKKELNLTKTDRKLKQLGVSNGARAKFLFEELQRLETKAEKRAYYQEMLDKKIITKDVKEQLDKLLSQ